jgi:DeoR/GlpR family transcriptional regulator of sugar metabolism
VITTIKVSNFYENYTRKKVLEILETQQYASVDELSTVLRVSTSTIRRTLDVLQQKGLVTRTHGGVKINSDNNFSPSFTFRIHQNSFEKKKIALSAIKLIKNGDLIFLDGSTSAFYIAEYLKEFENIRVITNGIDTL